ncbi:hypothetical protein NPIL_5991, partial [Nephila pilipes]
ICLESLETNRGLLSRYTALPSSLFEAKLDRIQENWDCDSNWSVANGLHRLFCQAYYNPRQQYSDRLNPSPRR